MNHVYRVVWNVCAECWQAVAETAKGHGKSGAAEDSPFAGGSGLGAVPNLKPMVLAVAAALVGLPSYAGPEGGSVARGNASISQNGTATTINQSSDRAVINWNRFSVGADESVRFNQPSKTSATLNRVTGAERSDILGSMSANGHVFLINPNGVLVGKGAQVNVGGFIASSLDMDDEDFMSGKINLKGESVAAVTNEGDINADEGGTVVLIAAEVNNTGTISASQGSVVLAATSSIQQGATTPAPVPAPAPVAAPAPAPAPQTATTESGATAPPVVASAISAAPVAPAQIVSGGGNTADAFTVRLQDGSNIAFTIDKGALNALVNNSGLIKAQGGQVILTAKGRDELSKATVNHSGVIEAQTLTTRNGVVELLADMQVGEVKLSGRIDASAVAPNNAAPTQSPTSVVPRGFVETSAARVQIAGSAKVDTRDLNGGAGEWLIDPDGFNIQSGIGGNIAGSTLTAILSTTNATIASVNGTGADGNINVNESITWSSNRLRLNATNDINVNANLNGSGSARLEFLIGQGSIVAGNTAKYTLNKGAEITLSEGENFSLKKGSDGITENYTVITRLGVEGDSSTSSLQGMKNNPLGKYLLGADIDATATASWNSGAGWQPVGNTATAFSGHLEGGGHSINALTINNSVAEPVGMFGKLTGQVSNLHLVDVDVSSSNPVWMGSLAGYLEDGGSVTRVSASGSVRELAAGIGAGGGLIGTAGIGTIRESMSAVDVQSSHAVGGLVGYNFATIENSYATGDITGNSYGAGGLVGLNNGTIINSYSTGRIQGTASVGGLVGYAGRDAPSTIINSFWDVETSGLASSSGGGTGKSTAEMQQQSTYVGWDFTNTWVITEGNSFPTLLALAPAPDTGPGTGLNPRIEVTATAPVKPDVIIGSYIVTAPSVVCAKSTAASCAPQSSIWNPSDLSPIKFTEEQLKAIDVGAKKKADYLAYEVDWSKYKLTGEDYESMSFAEVEALLSDMRNDLGGLELLPDPIYSYYRDELAANDEAWTRELMASNKINLKDAGKLAVNVLKSEAEFLAAFATPPLGSSLAKFSEILTNPVNARLIDTLKPFLSADIDPQGKAARDVFISGSFGVAELSGLSNSDLLKFGELMVNMILNARDAESLSMEQGASLLSGIAGGMALLCPPGPAKAFFQFLASSSDSYLAGSEFDSASSARMLLLQESINSKYEPLRREIMKERAVEMIRYNYNLSMLNISRNSK